MATIGGNEAPEYRGPFILQPGPILIINPYELVRRASYWRPTRWIMSTIYARHWNKRRGVRFEVQAFIDWAKAMTYGNSELMKELEQPTPLLTEAEWR